MPKSCSVCHGYVRKNHRKLLCSLCNKLVHKKCSDLTNKEFHDKLTHSNWFCRPCNDEIMLPFNHITNEHNYFLELYHFFENDKMKYDIFKDKFENMSYDPTVFQFDSDDDVTYNNQSSYYTDKLPTDLQNGLAQNNLSMLNINIRSLYKNFDSLKDFIHCTQTNFDIIGLVETWFKDIPPEYFNLTGYNLEFQNRVNKTGGGVCLYIKDDIKYKVRTDLQEIKCPENVEVLFIEIDRPNSKNIVVGVVYRPPDQDVNVFNSYIDNVLTNASKNQKLIYLMGDFNINI